MDAKTAEAIEQLWKSGKWTLDRLYNVFSSVPSKDIKQIVGNIAYEEYMLSGAGLRITITKKETMSFYYFTVASTDTRKHMELWVLSTKSLAEKIRKTRAKKFPVSEIFETDNDETLSILSNPCFKYPLPTESSGEICQN